MKSFLFFVLILLILQGCSFKPYGEEFLKIDPTGKLPDIEINLNLAADTIFIHQNQNITFAYAPNGDQIIWAKFIVNGQETEVQKDQSGNIKLAWDFNVVQGGIYPLELKIFARSQTGSIADKVNAEGYLISRKWTMVVRDYNQLDSKFTKLDFVDGSLKIEWDKFIGKDFKNYKVYKHILWWPTDTLKLVATITSREQTSCVDNTYHGENSTYYILTNDEFKGDTYSISGPFPTVTASNTVNGNIQLTWNKPPFYRNLKGYQLSYRDENGITQLLAELNSTDINSFTFTKPIFAFNYQLYLSMMPLTDQFYNDLNTTYFLSSSFSASYGINTPTFKFALGGMAPISYFLDIYNQDGIVVFDHQKLKTVRKLRSADYINQFYVSANNKYLVAVPYFGRKIYFEDLIDTTKSKKVDLSVTFPQLNYLSGVSDAGTGVMINNKTAVLFDYLNERKLAEITLSFVGLQSSKISSSGNFFFCLTDIEYEFFQYKNNQIIRLQKVNNQYGEKILHVDYLPGNNEKLIRAFANRVEVVDCNTWTIEKQWLFPDLISDAYNLDKKSGKLLMRIKNKLILLDLMSGTKEEIATTIDTPALQNGNLFYNNGMTFWSYGKALK